MATLAMPAYRATLPSTVANRLALETFRVHRPPEKNPVSPMEASFVRWDSWMPFTTRRTPIIVAQNVATGPAAAPKPMRAKVASWTQPGSFAKPSTRPVTMPSRRLATGMSCTPASLSWTSSSAQPFSSLPTSLRPHLANAVSISPADCLTSRKTRASCFWSPERRPQTARVLRRFGTILRRTSSASLPPLRESSQMVRMVGMSPFWASSLRSSA